ncbi:MAG TPA: type II toxin-antitoxin system VapC family toxin [Candidatus Obscuribacterales bacterium]
MRFWDSSAVLPLLRKETATAQVMKWSAEDRLLIVWWGTVVECAAALARVEREGNLPVSSVAESLERLRELSRRWQEIQPSDALRELATRLLRVHNLRASDSMQLAAAIIASEHSPHTLEFVCLDARLSAIAQREGFPVLSLP